MKTKHLGMLILFAAVITNTVLPEGPGEAGMWGL